MEPGYASRCVGRLLASLASRPIARVMLGVVSLAGCLHGLIRLPSVVRFWLSAWAPRPAGEFAWLLTLGLPAGLASYLWVLVSASFAVGLGVVGVGLLLARRHAVCVGLAAFAPSLVSRVLLIPGYIAIAAGRMAWEFPALGVTSGRAEAIRPDIPWRGVAALAGAAINIAYFLWVWRELGRLGPGRECMTRTDSPPSPMEA